MKKEFCQICGCEIGLSLDDGGYGDVPTLLCECCKADAPRLAQCCGGGWHGGKHQPTGDRRT